MRISQEKNQQAANEGRMKIKTHMLPMLKPRGTPCTMYRTTSRNALPSSLCMRKKGRNQKNAARINVPDGDGDGSSENAHGGVSWRVASFLLILASESQFPASQSPLKLLNTCFFWLHTILTQILRILRGLTHPSFLSEELSVIKHISFLI